MTLQLPVRLMVLHVMLGSGVNILVQISFRTTPRVVLTCVGIPIDIGRNLLSSGAFVETTNFVTERMTG